MADKPFDVQVTQDKLAKLQAKASKYPYYAIQQGMEGVADYLNGLDMREMYPPESEEPFKWSSDKQRMAYFASNGFGAGIPYSRTYELADSGQFTVHTGEEGGPYSSIGYSSPVPYSKYVIGAEAIIGLVKRGWKTIDKFVSSKSRDITNTFRQAVRNTWDKMEEFMYGGGAGL